MSNIHNYSTHQIFLCNFWPIENRTRHHFETSISFSLHSQYNLWGFGCYCVGRFNYSAIFEDATFSQISLSMITFRTFPCTVYMACKILWQIHTWSMEVLKTRHTIGSLSSTFTWWSPSSSCVSYTSSLFSSRSSSTRDTIWLGKFEAICANLGLQKHFMREFLTFEILALLLATTWGWLEGITLGGARCAPFQVSLANLQGSCPRHGDKFLVLDCRHSTLRANFYTFHNVRYCFSCMTRTIIELCSVMLFRFDHITI